MRFPGLLAATLVLTLAGTAEAKVRRHRSHAATTTAVKKHVIRKGAVVKRHRRTSPDLSPGTGKAGTRPRDGETR